MTATNQVPEFKIADTKFYVPVVTLSTQDNVKLLKQLEQNLVLKEKLIRININLKQKISSKIDFLDLDLGILIDPSFQRVNRLFDLSLKDKNC